MRKLQRPRYPFDDVAPRSCVVRSRTSEWLLGHAAVIGSLNIGGCERHLATVYPQLAAAGLKVGIVTFQRGGPLEDEVRAGGVDILCLDRGVLRCQGFSAGIYAASTIVWR